MNIIIKHLISLIVFISLTTYLFSPVFFENKEIKQHDIEQWKYSANETIEFRKNNKEEALWSNSMFSGMPAYLIDIKWSNYIISNIHKIYSVFFPHPVSNILISFISFYIMLLCFRVKPEIALFGSIAFTLSSYLIVGIAAGHNARIGTVALFPLIIGGIHLCITRNRNLGFIITAVALALQLRLNHLQITYYTLFILIFYGTNQLIYYYYKNQIKFYFKRILVLKIAAMLAIGTFFGEIWAVLEYSSESIRGNSEITNTSGLDKDYAFQYSNGIFEPLTLFIPNILGGSSRQTLERDSNLGKELRKNNVSTVQINNQLRNVPTYWGNQPLTAPYFAGSITLFFLILGIMILKRSEKNWIIGLLLISVILSMGSNLSFINNIFFDYLPGYNKFRSVTFIIIISLFSLSLFSSLTLNKLLSDVKKYKKHVFRAFLYSISFYIFIFCLSFLLSYSGSVDSNFENFPSWFTDALSQDRKNLLITDLGYASFFTLILYLSYLGIIYKNLNKQIFTIVPIAIISLDHLRITTSLIRDDKSCEIYGDCTFINKKNKQISLSESDQFILENNSNRKRVYNLQNTFNDAKTSYFHSSIGGYHGAKMRRYQDLIEKKINKERELLVDKLQNNNIDFSDLKVINMLNVGYIKFGEDRNNVVQNRFSNGNAWYIDKLIPVNSPKDEIEMLSDINTKKEAVYDNQMFDNIKNLDFSSEGNIEVVEYNPNKIIYRSKNQKKSFLVFSEIYYPHGWKVLINGKESKLIRVNYILRGLELSPGNHTIEMKFEPKAYMIGDKVILASNYILLILLISIIFIEIKKNRK